MNHSTALFFRLLFSALFFGTLLGGFYLLKYGERIFGVDPNVPSENGSARSYNKVMIFAIWGHAVLLTGAAALLLD